MGPPRVDCPEKRYGRRKVGWQGRLLPRGGVQAFHVMLHLTNTAHSILVSRCTRARRAERNIVAADFPTLRRLHHAAPTSAHRDGGRSPRRDSRGGTPLAVRTLSRPRRSACQSHEQQGFASVRRDGLHAPPRRCTPSPPGQCAGSSDRRRLAHHHEPTASRTGPQRRRLP